MLEKTVGTDLRGHAVAPSLRDQLVNDQRVVALLFLLPTILVLCFVVTYPFFSAIVISFQDKMIGGTASYIGLGNYFELFGDRVFLKVIRNTIVLAVAIKFLLGLAMALVLAQDRPFIFVFRTVLFIPWAVPTIVAALSFRWI
jgi:multiple sugar transport system permease protein